MNTDDYIKPYTSIEETIEDANNTWKIYLNHFKSDATFRNKPDEERLSIYQKQCRRFFMNFPIMLRYMVAHNWYYAKAFKRYITKLQTQPVKNDDEKMERDAEYIKYLYRERCKNTGKPYDSKYAATLSSEIYKELKKQKVVFEKKYKDVQKKSLEEVKLHQQNKRKLVADMLRQTLKDMDSE